MAELLIPQSLKEYLANNDVTPLIGAGVSMSVNKTDGSRAFPSWFKLLKRAADKLKDESLEKYSQMVNLQVETGMYQEAAKVAQKQLSDRRWVEFLNSQFDVDFKQLDDSCKALPKAIWQLSN